MSLAEKRAALSRLFDQAELLTLTALEQDRELTDDERIEVERLTNEFEKLNAQIKLLERVEQAGEYLAGSAGRKTDPEQPGSADPDERVPAVSRGFDIANLARPHAGRSMSMPGRVDPVQRFMSEMRAGGGNATHGFRTFGEYLQAVASDRADRRLTAYQAANEGVGSQGGYLVPTQYATDLLGGAIVTSELLSRCSLYPMSGPELRIAGANTLDHSAGKVAGVKLEWVEEGGTITAQDPKIRGINLYAKKGAILLEASSELLEDAATAERELTDIMISAIRLGLENAILNGTGLGQPRGVLKSPALITVNAEGGQAADTIVWGNIKSMIGRFHPSALKGAMFVATPSAISMILGMTVPVKNVAGNENVGGSTLDAVFDAQGMLELAGLPVAFSETLPLLGDVGDIVLLAPSEIALGVRRQMTIAVDASGKFEKDIVRFRLTCRMDGASKWATAVTPMGGGSTLSPYVTLAAR